MKIVERYSFRDVFSLLYIYVHGGSSPRGRRLLLSGTPSIPRVQDLQDRCYLASAENTRKTMKKEVGRRTRDEGRIIMHEREEGTPDESIRSSHVCLQVLNSHLIILIDLYPLHKKELIIQRTCYFYFHTSSGFIFHDILQFLVLNLLYSVFFCPMSN